MKLPSKPDRVGIFAFYDADGIVDDYIPVLVGAVREHCAYLLCVVNGELTAEGRQKLAAVSDEILCRPNEGLDVTGYKEGLFHLEERARGADEVLFFNQTVFGPLYPLEEMFSAMGTRDLDFWGMTRHKGLQADLTGTVWEKVEYGYIPPHIQSYFFAVRSSLLQSPEFWKYWRGLPQIHDYMEAVSFHEIKFTKYFEDKGFCSAPYLDCPEWDPYMDYSMMGMPALMVKEKRAPVVKRKSFFAARTSILGIPFGGESWELYLYLSKLKTYRTEYILQNITRTVSCAAYTAALAPTFCPQSGTKEEGRTALVLWLSDPMIFPYAAAAARSLPAGGQIFCLVTDGVLKAALEDFLPQAKVLIEEKNGFFRLFRDLWQEIKAYQYCCYLPLVPAFLPDSLQDMSLVHSNFRALGDISADLKMLREVPGISVLSPIPEGLGNAFFNTLSVKTLSPLVEILKEAEIGKQCLGEELLRLPGSAFFAETKTLELLSGLPWEKISSLKTELPAEEFLLPLAAQSCSKLCGFCASWADVTREYWNAREYAMRFARIFKTPSKQKPDLIEYRMRGIKDFYDERRYQMTLEQAFKAKLGFKQKLWIIVQLLLSPQAFERLQRLLHGGKLPPAPPHPQDPLD